MPCTYYTAEELLAIRRQENEELQKKFDETAKELNKTTDLLCRLMTKIEKGDRSDLSDELCKWWIAHQKKDTKKT